MIWMQQAKFRIKYSFNQYENDDQIKIKLLSTLQCLIRAQPEFLYSGGRIQDDILPFIRIHFGICEQTQEIQNRPENLKKVIAGPGGAPGSARAAEFNGMDWKLARACLAFLRQCQTAFASPQQPDQTARFQDILNSIAILILKINEKFDIEKETARNNNKIQD